MKVGLVSPYGWGTPGGVQIHIEELANWLINQGHQVSVLAPVIDEDAEMPTWLVNAGKPVPIPFNGSVARILFGPIASSRVRTWISENEFDVLHLHEPAMPSLSLLAGWAADGPIVATFHAAMEKQRTLNAIGGVLDPLVEKITAKIAVSNAARETLKERFETEAVVIPNGVNISKFADSSVNPQWITPLSIGFIGRFNEPRKGLEVLLKAWPAVSVAHPEVQLLVAGPGDEKEFSKMLESIPAHKSASQIRFLGKLSEEDKVRFFHSVSAYIAPNTGGESFGIILVEAMASGTPIVASDIDAFQQLLSHYSNDLGECGVLFENENPTDLARKIISVIENEKLRQAMSTSAIEKSKNYDWSVVGVKIVEMYELAQTGNGKVRLASENRIWNRWKS
jgi:phosphatidylinositol alpha-mannosyltransferase